MTSLDVMSWDITFTPDRSVVLKDGKEFVVLEQLGHCFKIIDREEYENDSKETLDLIDNTEKFLQYLKHL